MKTDYKQLSLAPFTFLVPSIRNICAAVIAVLAPQIVMLFITKSFSSLILVLCAVSASFCAELLHSVIHRTYRFKNLFFAVQGLLTGMLIPAGYPPGQAFFYIFLSFLVVKYAFGGNACSWINPTAFSIIMLYFLGTKYFPSAVINSTSADYTNFIQLVFNDNSSSILPSDVKITAWLNSYIFSIFGIEIPDGYITLLWDSGSSIPAFRFNALTLFATVILFAWNMTDWLVPAVCTLVYGLLVRFFAAVPFTGSYLQGDILAAFLSSGTLFCIFFILDWQGTVPLSIGGKAFYAAAAGILLYMICGPGMSAAGSVFTILLVNILSPVLQLAEEHIYTIWLERVVFPRKSAVRRSSNVQHI